MINKGKCDISLFGSSYRPENWMPLYQSIGDNDVAFEIVFVGPNEPDFKLPDNFKFIKSYVKPSQCFEIAARHTSGELIMNIPDDVEFKGARPLDRLYNTYKSYNNEKLIVSCRYVLSGEEPDEECHYFFAGDKTSPMLALASLMSRDLYMKAGGVDRNFLTVMADNDLTMRVHAMGGKVVLSDVYLEEDKQKGRGSELCDEYWKHERGLMLDLWVVDGKVGLKRSRPFEPFSNNRILEVSQGPRGRWKGSRGIWFEKLSDMAHFFIYSFFQRKPSYFEIIGRAILNPRGYSEYVKKIFNRVFSPQKS